MERPFDCLSTEWFLIEERDGMLLKSLVKMKSNSEYLFWRKAVILP